MPRPNARLVAAQVLLRRIRSHTYIEDLLNQDAGFRSLPERDRRLARELTLGVTRWQGTLDWLVKQRTRSKSQDPLTLTLLRLGLYQLFWLDRVPEHAAVDTTVELAFLLGAPGQKDFLNGVLRACCRQREAIPHALEELKHAEPHRGWSHPRWLVDRWVARWGMEKTRRLLEWNNLPTPRFGRVNLLKTKPDRLLERWRMEDVEYDFGYWSWVPENTIFELKAHPPLEKLESFQQGWFYIQDPSTLLAVHMLDPRPEERVLDVCAAPGGKTTYIAQLMDDDGIILALDQAPERVRRLEQNCRRLGLRSVVCGEYPDDEPGPPAEGQFDRVLVDAPCSNTGVMRRRVDLRWRIKPEEIERLRALQHHLLSQSAECVRPGGVLVYSTCSLEPEENRGVVDAFLAEHPEFELTEDRELFPPEDRADGAYAAKMIRRG